MESIIGEVQDIIGEEAKELRSQRIGKIIHEGLDIAENHHISSADERVCEPQAKIFNEGK